MPRLSILELGRVREGGDRRTALDEARELARRAEDWATNGSGSPSTTTCRR